MHSTHRSMLNLYRAQPILIHLGTGWEKAFQRRLPTILKEKTSNASCVLQDFHEIVETRARQQGTGLASMAMLSGQQRNYAQTLTNMAEKMVIDISDMQRSANRAFTPVVKEHMTPAYEVCTNEHGLPCRSPASSQLIS